MELGLKASAISCPRALFRFFTRRFWQVVSTHLVTPTAVLKLGSASSPGVQHQITRPLTATSVLKTKFFIPISADEKVCYFRFRILANHLASFFFLHPVRRFVRTTISSTRVGFRSTDSLTYILYFLQQAGPKVGPTFLILLLRVSLWRPVNSNTEG